LSTYYWSWLEYVIEFETHHISDSYEKLDRIIDIICHSYELPKVLDIPGISISKLRHVIDNESDKTYLNRQVDEINKKGLFRVYKELCAKISSVIQAVNPQYEYPRATVSTIMEAAHQQSFFAQHLPSLTEVSIGHAKKVEIQAADFIKHTMKLLLK